MIFSAKFRSNRFNRSPLLAEAINLTKFGIFVGPPNHISFNDQREIWHRKVNLSCALSPFTPNFTWIGASYHGCEATNLKVDRFWNIWELLCSAHDREHKVCSFVPNFTVIGASRETTNCQILNMGDPISIPVSDRGQI